MYIIKKKEVIINKDKNLIIFGLSKSQKLAKAVAEKTNIPYGEVERTVFADQEILLRAGTSVRNKDVFVFQSTSAPANFTVMELLIFIDALKRASANSINIIMPYYGYARQDRKAEGRQPITAKLIANLLERAGADRVTVYDLHSSQIQGFFDIPIDDIGGAYVLAEYIRKSYKDKNNLCIVSPDQGGIKRAKKLAKLLGNIEIAIVDKTRTGTNEAVANSVLGNVNGKHCILIDDMIDTGGTICKAAELLKEQGATEIGIYCTHGVFSGNAIKNLQESVANEVVILDTIEQNVMFPKLKILSIVDTICSIIEAWANHESISEILKA